VGLLAVGGEFRANKASWGGWQLEHITGKYVISDKPLTEDEWIKQTGATVIDGDDAIDVTPPENKGEYCTSCWLD
jgi:hypothetical protein